MTAVYCLDKDTLFLLGEYYKSIGRHDLSGPIFAKLNLFAEFDFIEIEEKAS